jgi:hypothetical protein
MIYGILPAQKPIQYNEKTHEERIAAADEVQLTAQALFFASQLTGGHVQIYHSPTPTVIRTSSALERVLGGLGMHVTTQANERLMPNYLPGVVYKPYNPHESRSSLMRRLVSEQQAEDACRAALFSAVLEEVHDQPTILVAHQATYSSYFRHNKLPVQLPIVFGGHAHFNGGVVTHPPLVAVEPYSAVPVRRFSIVVESEETSLSNHTS